MWSRPDDWSLTIVPAYDEYSIIFYEDISGELQQIEGKIIAWKIPLDLTIGPIPVYSDVNVWNWAAINNWRPVLVLEHGNRWVDAGLGGKFRTIGDAEEAALRKLREAQELRG